jgi:hypothetical protein
LAIELAQRVWRYRQSHSEVPRGWLSAKLRRVLEHSLADSVHATDNGCMVIPGKVENGVVVIGGDLSLPEGAEVSVMYPPVRNVAGETHTGQAPQAQLRRVQLPLVRSNAPGTRRLTAEDIAELLDQEDVSAGR